MWCPLPGAPALAPRGAAAAARRATDALGLGWGVGDSAHPSPRQHTTLQVKRPGPYLVSELDVSRRVAQLPADIHHDPPGDGLRGCLDSAHDPGLPDKAAQSAVGVHILGTHACPPPTLPRAPVACAPSTASAARLQASHSPCGHGVALRLEDAVPARHTDRLDILCSDPQIGPKDGDPDAAAQRARLRMNLELAEPS